MTSETRALPPLPSAAGAGDSDWFRPDGIPRRRARAGVLRRGWGRLGGILILLIVLAVLILLSLAVGAKSISPATVWGALVNFDASVEDHLIITGLRVPRTVLAILAGTALGLGGAVMQGLTRNPLADPGILGVNAGAALLVVFAIAFFGITSVEGYVWFAFAGAAAASVAVYAVGALGRDGATPVKLALAGAAITTLLGSVTSALMLADAELQNELRFWVTGSVAARPIEMAAEIAPFIVIGILVALACGPALNALALGEDLARGVGQRVGLARVSSAIAVVVLCGAATAAVGPIGFVGLVVPHIARMITGPDYRWILLYSMLIAPSLLLAADIFGRVIVPPAELQAGIVLAAIGAPFFVWLVRRKNLAEL